MGESDAIDGLGALSNSHFLIAGSMDRQVINAYRGGDFSGQSGKIAGGEITPDAEYPEDISGLKLDNVTIIYE